MKRVVTASVLALSLLMVAAIPLMANEVRGHVRGLEKGASHSQATLVVYAESLDGATPITPGRFKMAQRGKTFVPHILAIPAGSKVDFPNEDPIFHNVFSQSSPSPFNLGMYPAGQWRSRVFAQPAIYQVFCKIHPQMAAVILVLPTSFISVSDTSGNYRLQLPPGRFRITAWSESTQPVTAEITVSTATVEVPDLVALSRRAEPGPRKNQ